MSRGRALWLSGGASVVLFAALAALDLAMREGGGEGMIAFQFAGSPQDAERMIATWGEDGRSAARASLIVDFAYIGAYVALLALLCRTLGSGSARPRIAALGVPAALVAVAAGAFDCVENALLLSELDGHTGTPVPQLAAGFAALKFTSGGVVWVYVLVAVTNRLTVRERNFSRRSGAERSSR